MYIPDSIKAYTEGKPYTLDEVGMSGARILCFEDCQMYFLMVAG